MRSVGVIGGLGPETTSEFYLNVIFQCQEKDDTKRPSIVIANVPLPFEIERDLIATNTGKERYIPYLQTEAKRLENSQVDFIVMPCNSLHVFIDEIRSAVTVPVLSIVEETVEYIKQKSYKNVGLISTSATVLNKVYEQQFQAENINFITPNDLQHAKMDQIIQRLINGQHLNKDREEILAVAESLRMRQADCIALACTDLQLLLPSSNEIPMFDTMEILANATVREILR